MNESVLKKLKDIVDERKKRKARAQDSRELNRAYQEDDPDAAAAAEKRLGINK